MQQRATRDVEYTLAQLAWIDLLVRREVTRFRLQRDVRPDEDFRGLYISDQEADDLLAGASLAEQTPEPADDPSGRVEAELAAVQGRLEALETEARQAGEMLRLARLRELFGLSAFEQAVLVICLAAEVELKYERLYAYLQDDVTKKRPTVDLSIRLLNRSMEERLAARAAFEPAAPLLRWDLISLHDDPGARRPVLPARYLKLDERIAGYLLGSDAVDPRLLPLVAEQAAPATHLPAEVLTQLTQWAQNWQRSWAGKPPVILFHGRYGTGRRAAGAYLAAELGRPLLILGADALHDSEIGIEKAFKLAEREALLTGALVCWEQTDELLHPSPDAEADHRACVRALAGGRAPTLLLAEKPWEPARDLNSRPFLRMELPEPTYAERRTLWAASLTEPAGQLGELELNALAARFRLTAGQMRDAVARAHTLAWQRDPGNGHVQVSDIDEASRGQAQHSLGALARKLALRYTWDDIVLPRPQLAVLRLICTTVRQRPTVYSDWGFDVKLSSGKGLIALFAGPSGTGKTMAADIIGNALSLDVYKIDLSAVVSKYIGETEKNLERIFSEAQNTDAILFFDEADALFGKRSEVKDAHDRYANIEIAYLLQRTEEYNGLVILASNIKKNMDEAFVRRLHFMVDFPFPEETERLEIWKRTFPAQAPRAGDIDLPFLAQKLKITGGNIRNIILTSAFLAADDGGPIAMRHLVRAAGHELQKMGKLVVEGDFERYFEMART